MRKNSSTIFFGASSWKTFQRNVNNSDGIRCLLKGTKMLSIIDILILLVLPCVVRAIHTLHISKFLGVSRG